MSDHNRLMEQKGVDYVGYIGAELGYLFRPTSRHDKGIDGELEITFLKEIESPFIGIQVKARSEFYISAENRISVNVSEDNLKLWRKYARPVILIAYDDSVKELYWTRVDNTSSTTIHVDLSRKFDKEAIAEFQIIISRFYGDFARKLQLRTVSEILIDLGETVEQVISPIEKKLTQAENFIKGENYIQAASIYETLCAIYDDKLLLWLNWCESLIFGKQVDRASTVSKLLLEKFPKNWEAHLLRGEYLEAARQNADAEVCFLKSLEMAPYSAIPWGRLGLLHYRLGKYEEGFEELSQAARYDSTDEWVMFDLALCCEALEENGKALYFYDEAIKLLPEFYDAFNNKGLLLNNVFRLYDALEAYDRAIEINPLRVDALYNSAYLLKDLGYNERAIQRYHTALDLSPMLAGIHYDLGCLYCRISDFSKATYHLNRSRELNPKVLPMGFIAIHDMGFKVAYFIEVEVADEIRIISVDDVPQTALLSHDFFNWYAENARQINRPLNPNIQRDRFPPDGPVSFDDRPDLD